MEKLRCPKCGSTFTIDEHAEKTIPYTKAYFVTGKDRLTWRRKSMPIAFCNGCEFTIKLAEGVTTT